MMAMTDPGHPTADIKEQLNTRLKAPFTFSKTGAVLFPINVALWLVLTLHLPPSSQRLVEMRTCY